MSNRKEIAVVFGATGAQGGSVARALARSGRYQVKGVTRDLRSDRARALIQDGVDLMDYDLNDTIGLPLILHGADVCFLNTATDFNDPNCLDTEVKQGHLVADYCKSEGVRHVIYSTQMNSFKICGLMARHLVAKAEIMDYMRYLGLPLTGLIMPLYYEDFFNIFRPYTQDGRLYHIELPMGTSSMDLMSVEDVGTAVLCAIGQREQLLDKTLSVCGDKLTTAEIAGFLTKYLRPKTFKDKQITARDWVDRHSDIPGASDWANMFQFLQRKDQKYNLAGTQKLNAGLRSFDQWVAENAQAINATL